MKLASWNVNGLRASWSKGLLNYIEWSSPDLLCLQETKIQESQLSEEQKNPKGYHSFWNPAEKAGYSGTAIYSKIKPLNILNGVGNSKFDNEGRVLGLEFKDFYVFSCYFPNSQRDHKRLGYKLEFCDELLEFANKLIKKKSVIICGDYNIAHTEIDLKNPKSNQNNAGFLPEERAWMSKFLDSGYCDGFRQFETGPGHYTWWSYRPGVREKNIGWRLDYQCYDTGLKDRVKKAEILSSIKGSDHCPIELVLAD